MQIQANLSQRAELGLALMPKMLQSIEILQLATADLANLIELELAQNETLEATPASETVEDLGDDRHDDHDDDRRDDRHDDRYDGDTDGQRGVSQARSDAEDTKQAMLNNVPAAAVGLMEHIREQLAWWELQPRLADKVIALAERLDSRGFLQGTDEELLEAVDGELLHEAMAVLRSLDPKGIGARDAVDALLMQVPAEDPDYEDIRTLLTVHLEPLARNKLPEVARRMGMSVADLQSLVDRVRELDPQPGAQFSQDIVALVRPDLVVYARDGQIDILVNDYDLPSLGINEDYAEMARAPRVEGEVKRYLRPKLESAKNLMYAVEQRRRTLARVGAAVMEHQKTFLERGIAGIKPLKMADVAHLLGLHTSTVSRAVAGKYIQTTHGVFLLRDFFDGARAAGSGSEQKRGRMGIQDRVRELIAGEQATRPLSDDDLVALLAASGIQVARRTVTKYRRELDIPSSWRRRRYASDR